MGAEGVFLLSLTHSHGFCITAMQITPSCTCCFLRIDPHVRQDLKLSLGHICRTTTFNGKSELHVFPEIWSIHQQWHQLWYQDCSKSESWFLWSCGDHLMVATGPEGLGVSGLWPPKVGYLHPTADQAPLATCSIEFKSLMLTYRVLAGSAPSYLNDLVWAHVTPRPLRSVHERHLAKPSVETRLSRLFSYFFPLWWNDLLRSVRARMTLSSFKKLLKIELFWEHLLEWHLQNLSPPISPQLSSPSLLFVSPLSISLLC